VAVAVAGGPAGQREAAGRQAAGVQGGRGVTASTDRIMRCSCGWARLTYGPCLCNFLQFYGDSYTSD